MTIRELFWRLWAWRRRRALDHELREDLELHVELLARDLEHAGMPPADALAAARRQVGNTTHLREESRDVAGFPAIDVVLRDVAYAFRGLRRAPGFAVTVVLTLALGIGANAAMFGVIDRLMFRPYPLLRDPGTVHRVYIQTTYRGRTSTNTTFPYRRYLDLTRNTTTIASAAAVSEWRFAVGTGAESRVRHVAGVSASLFDFFNAVPERGRFFSAAEDRPPAGTHVAVISHTFWVSELGSENVIGRSLKVGMSNYTIIGVAPAGFHGAPSGQAPDIVVPITTIPANMGAWGQESYLRDYSWDWTQVLVRRRPGLDADAVSRDLTRAYVLSRAAARALNPRTLPDSLVHPRAVAGAVKQAGGPGAGAEARVLLWVAGVAGIVLLIACANVASLMLVRVIRRRREITVRLALGVSRRRLAAQFMTEATLLALLGCAAGLVIAQWGGVAIRGMLFPDATAFNLATDWRTLAVALACATAAALLTAIVPVLAATRTDLAATLKSGAREGTFHRSRLRTVLLVVQAALSVVLLVGAGLFVRSFDNARSVPLGYDARPVLEATLDFRGFPMDSAQSAAQRRRMLAVAQSLPGAMYATRINSRLFGTNTANLAVPGIDSVEALGRFNFQLASPDYFRVMQMRVLRGRAFTAADREGAPRVAIVSEAMARALWPGADPLGKCIHVSFGPASSLATTPCATIVGVADNSAQQNLDDDPRFMYYLPVEQMAPSQLSTILIRMSSPNAASQMERVRRALTEAMPGDGLAVVRPLQDVVDDQSRSWRLGATLFIAFGGLALVVALVGLYGTVSYTVAQRMHELGVRVALGARSAHLVRLVMLQGVRVVAAGVTIGLGLALVGSRWIEPLLFHQSGRDPLIYAGVGLTMLGAAFAASAIPAIRAVRADPCTALRAE